MGKRAEKHLFTEVEDTMILNLVAKHGTKAWKIISKLMSNRSPRQCRERWKYYLSPNLEKGPWTEEEDLLLLDLIKTLEGKWSLISKHFHNRTGTNVKNRSKLLQRMELKKLSPLKKHYKKTELDVIDGSLEYKDKSEELSSPRVAYEDKMVFPSNIKEEPIDLNCCQIIDFWDQNQFVISEDNLYGW